MFANDLQRDRLVRRSGEGGGLASGVVGAIDRTPGLRYVSGIDIMSREQLISLESALAKGGRVLARCDFSQGWSAKLRETPSVAIVSETRSPRQFLPRGAGGKGRRYAEKLTENSSKFPHPASGSIAKF